MIGTLDLRHLPRIAPESARTLDQPSAANPPGLAGVGPVVAWLASAGGTITGRVFGVAGGKVQLFRPWSVEAEVEKPGRWSPAELARELATR